MLLTSRRPNERLLQMRRRAIFGRAVREPADTQPAVEAAKLQARSPELACTISASGDGVEGSRRRSRRIATADEVGVRRIGSFNFQAKLDDISSGGCRVELIERYDVGDRLVTRFPKLEPLGARVCWAMGNTAGIEFLNAMHPAVFDSLLMRLSAPTSPSNDGVAQIATDAC